MKINIKCTQLELTKPLKEFIEKKINALEKFLKVFSEEKETKKGKASIEAWVEVAKTTQHHQKGMVYYAECQLRLPRKSFRAVATRENLKMAIKEVKEELEREIKREKEKRMAKVKRGARVFKKELKISPAARFYRKGRIKEEGI